MKPENINVLVACEESQRVCIAFRARGFMAYSCDIQDCSGGHPEWHIKDDVLNRLDDGWDLIIAHPPCTYLSNVATRSFSLRCTDAEKVVKRWEYRAKAAIFFMYFVLADCPHIAVENPVGFMSNAYKKPDQIIHPYQFADSKESMDYVTKATCLWLKGLPKLKTNNLPKPNNRGIFGVSSSGKAKTWEECVCRHGGAAKARSKTFPGIAAAMAEQWGNYLLEVL